jgi:hypothetical protein
MCLDAAVNRLFNKDRSIAAAHTAARRFSNGPRVVISKDERFKFVAKFLTLKIYFKENSCSTRCVKKKEKPPVLTSLRHSDIARRRPRVRAGKLYELLIR